MTDRHDLQEFVLAQLRRLYPLATPLRMLLDVLAWSAAAALAVYLRFDLSFSEDGSTRFWRVIPLVAGLQILTGYSVGLYRRRWRYGSYDEVAALTLTAAITTTGLYLLNEHYFSERPIPQSAVLVGGVLGLVLMGAIRYMWRLVFEWLRRPDRAHCGKAARVRRRRGRVCRSSRRCCADGPRSTYPLALLDDDPAKQRLTISGVVCSAIARRSRVSRSEPGRRSC